MNVYLPNSPAAMYKVRTPGEIALLQERREKQGRSAGKKYRYEHPIEIMPDGKKIWARNSQNVPICNALLKGMTGMRCTRTSVLHNGRCSKHKGFTSTSIQKKRELEKHGSYSGLPARLLNLMDRAAKKPDPLSLLDDIRFTETQIAEISAKLEDIPPATIISGVLSRLLLCGNVLETEIEIDSRGEEVLKGRALKKVIREIGLASADLGKVDGYRGNTKEILGLHRHKSTLIETELRKRTAEANMMPTEDVARLCIQLTDIFLGVMKDAREIHEASQRVKQFQHKALQSGPLSSLYDSTETQYGASGAKSAEEIREMAEYNRKLAEEGMAVIEAEIVEDIENKGDIESNLNTKSKDVIESNLGSAKSAKNKKQLSEDDLENKAWEFATSTGATLEDARKSVNEIYGKNEKNKKSSGVFLRKKRN